MSGPEAALLGWTLTLLGVLFLLLGFVGAALDVFRGRGAERIAPPAGFFEALAAFLKALATAPRWLALVGVGVALVFFGQRLAAGLPMLPQ